MKIDLHTHTQASDGSLSPTQLVKKAFECGVEVLAVTDHDTLAGLAEAEHVASDLGVRFVGGVELSTCWRNIGIHVLGLRIDWQNGALLEAVAYQQNARVVRAKRIGEKLDKALKLEHTYEQVAAKAFNAEIGRPHFAQHLVELGRVKTSQEAFKKYLGAGKLGDIKDGWLSLGEVIQAITIAGGMAVLAHPAMYKLTNTQRKNLISDFKAAGGHGIEVSTAQSPDWVYPMAKLCEEFELLASQGSDYHGVSTPWATLGRLPPLPKSCVPIWRDWS